MVWLVGTEIHDVPRDHLRRAELLRALDGLSVYVGSGTKPREIASYFLSAASKSALNRLLKTAFTAACQTPAQKLSPSLFPKSSHQGGDSIQLLSLRLFGCLPRGSESITSPVQLVALAITKAPLLPQQHYLMPCVQNTFPPAMMQALQTEQFRGSRALVQLFNSNSCLRHPCIAFRNGR